MTVEIPIAAGKRIADEYGYDQVVIVARKVGGPEHVTTYGVDKDHCGVAARMGNFFKHKLMGWPKPEDQPVPLLAQQVIGAVCAVGDEAARRGEMYPQTSDEQRDDRQAVARVVEMLRWYEKNTGCARLKGWPVGPNMDDTEARLLLEGEVLAAQVGAWVGRLRMHTGAVHFPESGEYVTSTLSLDQRWISIGATQLQQGFMAVVRGIRRPNSF